MINFDLTVKRMVKDNYGSILIDLDRTIDIKIYEYRNGDVVSHWVGVRFIGTIWYGQDEDLQLCVQNIDYDDIFLTQPLPFDITYMCDESGDLCNSLDHTIEWVKDDMLWSHVFREDYVLPRITKKLIKYQKDNNSI